MSQKKKITTTNKNPAESVALPLVVYILPINSRVFFIYLND